MATLLQIILTEALHVLYFTKDPTVDNNSTIPISIYKPSTEVAGLGSTRNAFLYSFISSISNHLNLFEMKTTQI